MPRDASRRYIPHPTAEITFRSRDDGGFEEGDIVFGELSFACLLFVVSVAAALVVVSHQPCQNVVQRACLHLRLPHLARRWHCDHCKLHSSHLPVLRFRIQLSIFASSCITSSFEYSYRRFTRVGGTRFTTNCFFDETFLQLSLESVARSS